MGRCHGWYVNRKLGGRHRLAITRDDAGFFRWGCVFYLQRFPNQWPSPNSIIKQTCSVQQCSAPSSPTNKKQQILPCQKGDCKSTLQVQKWPPGFYRLALEELECSGRVYQLTPCLTDASDACVFLSNEPPKLLTFHCTGYFIGILKMVYYNPHIIWGRISSRKNPKPQGFLIAQLTLGDDLVCKFPHPGCCLVTTKIMINSFSSLTGWGSISQSCFQELELLWKKCCFAISKALHWVKIVSI